MSLKHEPTDENKAKVEALSAYGISQEEIAKYLNIAPKTLRQYYREELDKSRVDKNLEVATSLYRNATENNNVQAQIFWAKTQLNWSTKQDENSDKLKSELHALEIKKRKLELQILEKQLDSGNKDNDAEWLKQLVDHLPD